MLLIACRSGNTYFCDKLEQILDVLDNEWDEDNPDWVDQQFYTITKICYYDEYTDRIAGRHFAVYVEDIPTLIDALADADNIRGRSIAQLEELAQQRAGKIEGDFTKYTENLFTQIFFD
jgi:hypothetical protein